MMVAKEAGRKTAHLVGVLFCCFIFNLQNAGEQSTHLRLSNEQEATLYESVDSYPEMGQAEKDMLHIMLQAGDPTIALAIALISHTKELLAATDPESAQYAQLTLRLLTLKKCCVNVSEEIRCKRVARALPLPCRRYGSPLYCVLAILPLLLQRNR